ncbi:MAG: hypothetical protein K2M46_02755 [Lachnospiraceae bacterium]|nr:hypothetical protein [Lachnospiraceae bacterium]
MRIDNFQSVEMTDRTIVPESYLRKWKYLEEKEQGDYINESKRVFGRYVSVASVADGQK